MTSGPGNCQVCGKNKKVLISVPFYSGTLLDYRSSTKMNEIGVANPSYTTRTVSTFGSIRQHTGKMCRYCLLKEVFKTSIYSLDPNVPVGMLLSGLLLLGLAFAFGHEKYLDYSLHKKAEELPHEVYINAPDYMYDWWVYPVAGAAIAVALSIVRSTYRIIRNYRSYRAMKKRIRQNSEVTDWWIADIIVKAFHGNFSSFRMNGKADDYRVFTCSEYRKMR